MNAVLLLRERLALDDLIFAELVIWRVPTPLGGSSHLFKYRMALVVDGTCVLRYDNEAGKGDHKHIGEMQVAYAFADLTQLQRDFWTDVDRWRKWKGDMA